MLVVVVVVTVVEVVEVVAELQHRISISNVHVDSLRRTGMGVDTAEVVSELPGNVYVKLKVLAPDGMVLVIAVCTLFRSVSPPGPEK